MAGRGEANAVLTHFGRQVRKERLARGWSLDELSTQTGIVAPHLSRIETGRRPPTEKIALACDEAFPERRGWFLEYYEESKTWMPAGFRSFGEYENKAVRLHVWSPGVIDGLVQTESYARRMLSVQPGVTDAIMATRLKARMDRQKRVLFRDDPPSVWFVIDEMALYRCVGSAEIMAAQMRHLLEVARMPKVTMVVMPPVEHPANESELIIADDAAAYVEHMVGGYVYTELETVTLLAVRFDTLRAESRKASESLALIERMEETWATGVKAVSAGPTVARASKSRRLK
jgi:transcriptional regulator with XRE-family HTH domain